MSRFNAIGWFEWSYHLCCGAELCYLGETTGERVQVNTFNAKPKKENAKVYVVSNVHTYNRNNGETGGKRVYTNALGENS